MKKISLATALFVLASGLSMNANAASQSANANITIVKSLTLTKTADLLFPTAATNDPAYTVAPTDSEAAKFNLDGDINANITTSIAETSIEMTKDLGETPQQKILVNDFQHNAPPKLNGLGVANFGVGATHAAILADQESGSYAGVFNVIVSYQ